MSVERNNNLLLQAGPLHRDAGAAGDAYELRRRSSSRKSHSAGRPRIGRHPEAGAALPRHWFAGSSDRTASLVVVSVCSREVERVGSPRMVPTRNRSVAPLQPVARYASTQQCVRIEAADRRSTLSIGEQAAGHRRVHMCTRRCPCFLSCVRNGTREQGSEDLAHPRRDTQGWFSRR